MRSRIRRNKAKENNKIEMLQNEFLIDLRETKLSASVQENEVRMNELFTDCSDIVIRRFELQPGIEALAVFVDGLVNTHLIEEAMQVLMSMDSGNGDLKQITAAVLPVSQTKFVDNYGDLLISVLSGDTGLFIDRNEQAVLLGEREPATRSISEPETEGVIRGPREGFTENIRINTSMIRRKIKSPRLKMKHMGIGKISNTDIVITYIDGLVDPALVEETIARLNTIDIDAILESGYIEELIQDSAFSPFPQMQYTERPDMVAAALLQSRLAIIVDGTPFVLVIPTVFVNLMQSTEDYYERFQMGTLLRWLRYSFLFISLLTPGLYVAITTYHQEMLPTALLLSVAAAREVIPFPAVIEALLMEIVFEGLREAGLRLPRAVGQAVSILGALVVGTAAVQAGIVSAPMVIVVSITGIASFTIPHFNGAIALRMLRFPIIIAASLFGIYGILLSIMIIIGHMANLRSFGVPYLSPLGPISYKDLKDILIRAPQWALLHRPTYLNPQDEIREGKKLPDQVLATGGMKEAKGNDSNSNPHNDPQKDSQKDPQKEEKNHDAPTQ